MCGIAGILSKKEIERSVLERMNNQLRHRGPDDSGIFIDEERKLGLTHNRLSIIDLSERAHQPMVIDNFIISYNGEIYNFKEIRKELIEKGYSFFSNSDTEVITKSFQEWGIRCLDRFRGIFAFALWNNKEKKLYLVRDKFGVKPLYYYFDGINFTFASELKAIYQFPDFKREIDFKALGHYFQFGYIPAPLTIFKNTFKVEEGSFLEVDSDLKIKKEKYFKPEDYFKKDKIIISEREAKEELKKILKESFNYRMVSDVPVGVFLSGGIDSSLIAAVLAENSSKKLKTFTVGFKDKDYNEAPFAKRIADYLGTNNHQYYFSFNDIKGAFKDYIQMFDEPFGDRSGLPTFLLSKFAGREVKVALSGDGGDEMFLGYDKYRGVERIMKMTSFSKGLLKKTIDFLGPGKASKLLAFSNTTNLRAKMNKLRNSLEGKGLEEIFSLAGSYFTPEEVSKIIGRDYQPDLNNFYNQKNLSDLEQMQLWDIKNYLVDDILVKTDRTTMANGLEGRVPFIDEKILEFSGKTKVKIKKEKKLTKNILSDYLPKELFERPKMGFNIPLSKCLDKDDLIDRSSILNKGYINEMKKNRMIPDKIWLIISFQMWYKKWGN